MISQFVYHAIYIPIIKMFNFGILFSSRRSLEGIMTPTKPTYVYKLIPSTSPPPDPLPDRLPLSSLDTHSGFIHLSTAFQIPGTLKHFFKEDPHVYVLRIEYAGVEKYIKWEDPKVEGRYRCCLTHHRIDNDPLT